MAALVVSRNYGAVPGGRKLLILLEHDVDHGRRAETPATDVTTHSAVSAISAVPSFKFLLFIPG